jgi:hypothetical protein
MDETQLKNRVLIYLARRQTFVIWGIKELTMSLQMIFYSTKMSWLPILKKAFQTRPCRRILIAGEQLKNIPWSEDDTNELSNEISKENDLQN